MLIASPETITRLRKIRASGAVTLIQGGGPGSGCHGPNCGRPKGSGSAEGEPKAWDQKTRVSHVVQQGKAWVREVIRASPEIKAKMARVREVEMRSSGMEKALDHLGDYGRKFWDMSEQQRKANQATLEKVGERMDTLLQKNSALFNERLQLNREISEAIVAKITQGEPVPAEKKIFARITHDNAPVVNDAVQEFERLIGGHPVPTKSEQPDVTIKNVGDGGHGPGFGRSYYSYNEHAIYLRENAGRETVWHEMGHWLEHVLPGAEVAALSYLDRRTKGEKEQPLNDIKVSNWWSGFKQVGYRDDEVARPDKFLEPYIGKIYKDRATEITSMGMQYMAEDPVRFYRMDPDHFAFTIGTIRAARAGGFPWAKS